MVPVIRPEFAPILEAMSSNSVPIGDVVTRRNAMDPMVAHLNKATKAAFPELESKVGLRTHLIPTSDDGHKVPVLHYFLKDGETRRPSAAVVNMHPGGLITGSAKSMDAAIRQNVLQTGVAMFDVEYRLAPEHPYPTPHEDSWAALVWVCDHALDLGVDPDRIALMGESAGGYLAVLLALHARVKGIRISRLILVCPMLDDRTGQGPKEDDAQYSWTPEDNVTAWNAILGADRQSNSKSEIPSIPAKVSDVSGLPPTFLQVAGGDLFLDEDLAFGNLMARQGVDVEVIVYGGVPHGFEALKPDCDPSRRARQDRNRIIREL